MLFNTFTTAESPRLTNPSVFYKVKVLVEFTSLDK